MLASRYANCLLEAVRWTLTSHDEDVKAGRASDKWNVSTGRKSPQG
jgi:hypothetical protein